MKVLKLIGLVGFVALVLSTGLAQSGNCSNTTTSYCTSCGTLLNFCTRTIFRVWDQGQGVCIVTGSTVDCDGCGSYCPV